jgi:hypothetical protein
MAPKVIPAIADAELVAPVAEPDADAAAEAFDADADPGRGEAGTSETSTAEIGMSETGTAEIGTFGPMPVAAAGTVAAAVAVDSPLAVTCDAADAPGEAIPSPTPAPAPPAEPAS